MPKQAKLTCQCGEQKNLGFVYDNALVTHRKTGVEEYHLQEALLRHIVCYSCGMITTIP